MRCRIVVALVAIWLAGPVLAEQDVLLGVHSENLTALGGEPDRTAAIAGLGVQVVRLPVTWHLLEEHAKGQVPAWFWRDLDAEVAAAERIGVRLILTVAQVPCWASSDPDKDCAAGRWDVLYPPVDAQDYGDALGLLATRYRGRIMAYEVWNEPNLTWFWPAAGPRGAEGNDAWGSFVVTDAAADYAALLLAGAAAVHAADPGAAVLAGAMAGGDVAWLERLLVVPGVAGSFDALSMHPYTAEYPQDDGRGSRYGPTECPPGAVPQWCAAQGVEVVRAVLDGAGLADRDIWFTEFGFSSSHYWNGSAGPGWTSEQGQARYFEQMMGLIDGWGYVPVACWYELRDEAAHEPRRGDGYEDEREAHYGAWGADGVLKPVGAAIRARAGG